MRRLNIAAWVSTAIALVGFILIITNNYGGAFLLKFGLIAAATFCLVNAFWLISKRHLSSGACMYCILLLDLFIMFKILEVDGYMALFFAGIFFFVLAVIAKEFAVSNSRKQGVSIKRFDTTMVYASATTALSAIVLAA